MQTEELIEVINSKMREVETKVWHVDIRIYAAVLQILMAIADTEELNEQKIDSVFNIIKSKI